MSPLLFAMVDAVLAHDIISMAIVARAMPWKRKALADQILLLGWWRSTW